MAVKDTNRWTEIEPGVWARKSEAMPGFVVQTQRAEPEVEAALMKLEEIQPNATAGALAAAVELGIDLATVTGTGKDGRITKADVESVTSD